MTAHRSEQANATHRPDDSLGGRGVTLARTDIIAIGDDGETFLARGHVAVREFIEAISEWTGDPPDAFHVEDVEHRYVTVGPRDDYDEWFEWERDGQRVTAETPGAIPATILSI